MVQSTNCQPMYCPAPQIRLSVGPETPRPSHMAVFIGGYGDFWMGISRRTCLGFKGFVEQGACLKGYYHWDGGGWGMLGDRCHHIAADLAQAGRLMPGVPLVITGHSYGGSAAMEVARELHRIAPGVSPLIVLTIDAVSRRQPRTRAQGVLFWGNSYLYEGGGPIDVVPRIGGRWGASPEADLDLAFSGYAESSPGLKYSHRRPVPMIFQGPDGDPAGSLAAGAAAVLRGLAGDAGA